MSELRSDMQSEAKQVTCSCVRFSFSSGLHLEPVVRLRERARRLRGFANTAGNPLERVVGTVELRLAPSDHLHVQLQRLRLHPPRLVRLVPLRHAVHADSWPATSTATAT